MECRPLEITIQSAKDLKDVNLFSKMDVFAVVSVNGGDRSKPKQKNRTPVDKDCGPNPRWNHRISFTVDEPSLQQNRLTVKFELVSARNLGDREIGEVNVPIKELFGKGDDGGAERSATYAVRTSSGRSKGTLTFSYKFGEKFDEKLKFSAPAENFKGLKSDPSPVMAYPPPPAGYPPVGSSTGSGYPYQPPPQTAYPGHPPAGYPPQPGYGYPGYPLQPAYGGYHQNYAPPPPPAGYLQYQPGYGGGYPPQPMYGGGGYQKPHKSGGSGGKMALGMGAGLLGGLLVGDMISDVADVASYDAGFDDGFDF